MRHAPLAVVLCAGIGVSGPGAAVRQNRTDDQMAVNNCRAALPSFEGSLRKRPLGIANEGSGTAFISCALSVDLFSGGISEVTITLSNRGPGGALVRCTLVDGRPAPIGLPSLIPKDDSFQAGETLVFSWTQVDNIGAFFLAPSLSCALPPGVELNETKASYQRNVGL